MTATLLCNGRIATLDAWRPSASELLVVGDRIADRAAMPATPDADVRVVDLGGRTVVPGLIDAHHHLSLTALEPRFASLGGCSSFDDVAARLVEQAASEPHARWVRGDGWEQPAGLVAAMLDELDLGRPVIVAHRSIHQCVVDSLGLAELGFAAAAARDPDGGRIVRQPDGRPTGLLVERAWSVAHAASVADYVDPSRWGDLIVARAEELLTMGVTSVHDAACPADAEAVYAELAAAGRLPISVVTMPHPHQLFAVPHADRLAGARTGEGDETVRVGAIKLFADGGISMAVDAHRDGVRRVVGTAFPEVVEAARRSARAGFGVAVHAMGNAGLELALEAFEVIAADGIEPPLLRVEHLALATPDQLRRLAASGAIAVVQPGFVPMLGPNVGHVTWDDASWLPFRSALDHGVRLAASTDAPCAGVHPVAATCAGSTRRYGSGETLEEREAVDPDTWLAAWTVGAAEAGGQGHERGRLVPGLRADFVVLDGPLSASAPPLVLETWVAGRRVHATEAARP